MDKGDFRFKAWTGNLREDSPFPCGSGNHLRRSRGFRLGWLCCAAMAVLRAGTPPLLFKTPTTFNAISDMGVT
jgi:hypothetical protein